MFSQTAVKIEGPSNIGAIAAGGLAAEDIDEPGHEGLFATCAAVAHQRSTSPGCEIADDYVQPPFINVIGIEWPIVPFQHARVLLVLWISDRFKKLLETAGAADIFGWRAAPHQR